MGEGSLGAAGQGTGAVAVGALRAGTGTGDGTDPPATGTGTGVAVGGAPGAAVFKPVTPGFLPIRLDGKAIRIVSFRSAGLIAGILAELGTGPAG